MGFPVALLASLACLCGFAAVAPAATVTIGSPMTDPGFRPSSCSEPCTVVTTSLVDPNARAVSPVTGTIVRWRVREASPGAAFRLRVLTPGAPGVFTPTATAGAVPVGTGLETFSSAIPISAGQVIGLDMETGAKIGFTEASFGSYAYGSGFAPEGVASPFELLEGEVAFNADVQPPPSIASLAPGKGSIAGAKVTITGTDFSSVSGVSFGGVAARSFTVASETQLTAVAPKTAKPGQVDVVVTTIAGAATAATRFTYTACVVPKLTGKSLKADRKKLKKAGCKLGSVRGENTGAAKVVKQFRKPGAILPTGAKVGVKVGE